MRDIIKIVEDADHPAMELWAVVYMRPDGTPATRVEIFRSAPAANGYVERAKTIHGNHPNGNPRWRVVLFREVFDA